MSSKKCEKCGHSMRNHCYDDHSYITGYPIGGIMECSSCKGGICIEKKYMKCSCSKCGSDIEKINPKWLRLVRERAGISLREISRNLKKSAPYISDVELGHRNCTKYILSHYEKVSQELMKEEK